MQDPQQPPNQPNPYDFLNEVPASPDPARGANKRRRIFMIVLISTVILLIIAFAVALTTSSSQQGESTTEAAYEIGNMEVLRSAFSDLNLVPENDSYVIDGCGNAGDQADQSLCYYTLGYYYEDTSYFTTIQGALESNSWEFHASESEDVFLNYSKSVNNQKVCATLSYGGLDEDDQRVSLALNTKEYTCQ